MASFTIWTGPVPLFATAPAIPGGPIEFIPEVLGAANQQWLLAAAGPTPVVSVGGPAGPGFANVGPPDIVPGTFVDVGPGPINWCIARPVGAKTIGFPGALPPLFWGLNDINQAILVNAAAQAIFNFVPV